MVSLVTDRSKAGRISKYSPERVERILSLLRAGNTRNTSAQASGISVDTFGRWLVAHADFAQAVKESEAEAEASHVQNIATAAVKGSWQASAWWLERRRHAEWGRKDRIEVVNSVREMATNAGVSEDAAVQQAEQILRELRSAARA